MCERAEIVVCGISLDSVLKTPSRTPRTKRYADALQTFVEANIHSGLEESSATLRKLCNDISSAALNFDACAVEVEIQLHLQPPACDCCCNMKYSGFCERLAARFGELLPNPKNLDEARGLKNMQRLIVYDDELDDKIDATESTESAKLRIFFGHGKHERDKKLRIHQSLLRIPLSEDIGIIAVSVEAKRKRLSACTKLELEEVRKVLRRASKYPTALNRFFHPADGRLSITYREPANRDESFITLEYEVTARELHPLDFRLIEEFKSIFPHHCWGFQSRSERCRSSQKFLHQWRPKVYTLCPQIGSESPSRDVCINDCLKIVQESRMYAVKWNGIQHIFKFDFRVGNNFCGLNGLSANYVPGFYFEIPVCSELFADKGNRRGKVPMLENNTFFISNFFFVAEVFCAASQLQAESDQSITLARHDAEASECKVRKVKCPNCKEKVDKTAHCIVFVDVTNEHLSHFSMSERIVVLNSLMNDSKTKFLSTATGAHFCLQKWFADSALTADKVVASKSLADGMLVYSRRDDVLWKVKQHHSVDLVNTGVLHTEDGVFVARTTSSAQLNRISEYEVTWHEGNFILTFIRTRDDRVLGNSIVEFCEAAKSAWANPFDWI